jgi:hypothetical protein
MHHKAHEKLKMNIEELLMEANRQGWKIEKTKMMIIALFDLDEGTVRSSKNFWHKVYEENLLDKEVRYLHSVVGDKNDVDARLNWDEGEE